MSQPIGMRPTGQWLAMIDGGEADFLNRLEALYAPKQCEERRLALRRLIGDHQKRFGDSEALGIARAPGRLNVLGRHADHRGAYTNAVSLEWEMLMAFGPRDDDRFAFHNQDSSYGHREFALSELLPTKPLENLTDWLEWTGGRANKRQLNGNRNDWIHKLAAIPVYVQSMMRQSAPLRGIDAVLAGNVPRQVGLSSSSAVVMAVMEAVLAGNRLVVDPAEFVLNAGRAEWYVGTRGGFGDHAGIKLGRKGHITHLRSEPKLEVKCHLPFRGKHCFIIFHSGFEADKTGEAGQRFNEKTATYALGELYLRRWLEAHHREFFLGLWNARSELPEEKRIYLGDIVGNLADAEIFGFLTEVPSRRTRDELRREWPDHNDMLERLFGTHPAPIDGYAIQPVMTYGFSEVARCARAPEMLESGDMIAFGETMNASQDGDRVSDIPDHMRSLKDATDPTIPLWQNLGDYDCSTEQIDRMCRIALEAGALGAQLAGAGCGGSMMALVADASADDVVAAMKSRYFEPMGIEPRHWLVRPASGSCMI